MRMGINGFLNYFLSFTGPILESKGMHAIFQKMGKNLKHWAKMTKFENILEKHSVMHATIACMNQLEYVLSSRNQEDI